MGARCAASLYVTGNTIILVLRNSRCAKSSRRFDYPLAYQLSFKLMRFTLSVIWLTPHLRHTTFNRTRSCNNSNTIPYVVIFFGYVDHIGYLNFPRKVVVRAKNMIKGKKPAGT